LAAVPSIGRATRIERPVAPGAVAAGDLYERYSGQIYGYCLHQLGSREEAEDAVQTTFMNAFRGLARGIVPEVESAWLFKIAHNVCLSRRRSSWRRGRVEAPNNFEVLQEIVPGREPVADELIPLQDVLEGMPENQRRAILLREWQGLTYREISAELGLTQAAVETLIFRARRSLAQGLEEHGDSPTWKKRARRGADLGGALACLKMLLGGGGAAAMKITGSALAVATAALAASSSTPAPKQTATPGAKNRAGATSTPNRASTPDAALQIPATGIGSERTRPAGRRNAEPAAAHPNAAPAAATSETQPAAATAPATATATATTASTPETATSEPAATPPAPEAQPTETAPAPTPNHGKGKAKGKKDKPDHNPHAATPPTTAPADPAPAAPTDAAWGEPKPDPQPTPPSQESKPDKEAKADKPDKDHEHGNGKK
jgi:RNA polymerase sigma factor (sigma-70 family)